MSVVTIADDRGRELSLRAAPRRVVSLVPSDTLNVAALGCEGALVGRTDYCELPGEIVAKLPSVGGTKNPSVESICALSPDLVLVNQEENSKGDVDELSRRGVPVFVAFPKRVIEGLRHLARLARIFGVTGDARVKELVGAGYHALRDAEKARSAAPPLLTFCPIWMAPLMTIHGETFISDMLELCGAHNVFADRPRRYPLAADLGQATPLPAEKTEGRDVRYPRVTLEEVVARAPELVLLPDEPHPFTEADADVFRRLAIPASTRGAVVHTSGKDLCWYGARSVEGIGRLRALVAAIR
jgi:ABC-type Fe3+-hydroxamate transport system substrate-binding protein